ncbi:hypothetical protein BG011_001364 [Mortierella polycephala]|uniref:Uncharacterized protein n=1 Tax=Mortierella polycephala TaxID=41804 RepID=A0A9P6PKY5_9FUNG|nr:hypothetical protein BG011_001364 [Mortierella polycephala]
MIVNKPKKSDSQESELEALAKRLEAVSLDLRNMQLDLEDANDDLVSAQEELEDTRVKLNETELELKNAQDALAASEVARRAANRDRVVARPENKQEVFAVLKFRRPQPLPVGAFRLFALQRKAVQSTLSLFIANNPDLDAVEVDELRFDRSPRGQYVYQHMMDDKLAPIKFSRRNFELKDGHTEDEMVEYILSVFNTHTRE